MPTLFINRGPGCLMFLLLLAPGLILALVAALVFAWPWWGWLLTFVVTEFVWVQAIKLYERRELEAWSARQRGSRP